MKLRVTLEPTRIQPSYTVLELEGENFGIVTENGWLVILDAEKNFIVGYPPGVVRSVAEVGAWEKHRVTPSENSGRRQQAR